MSEPADTTNTGGGLKILLLLTVAMVIGGCSWYASTTFNYYQQLNGNAVDLSSFSGEVSASGVPQFDAIDNSHVNDYADDPQRGNPQAELVVVMFEDFQCPFCKRMQPGLKEAMARYDDQVLFVFRDFPLDTIHPDAQLASEAANCAFEQGKFWEYHDLLFTNQDRLRRDDLSSYALATGLNTTAFDSCLDSGKYTEEVEADASDAIAAGAVGTPTLYFNGNRVQGVLTADGFSEIIDLFLSQ